MPTSTYTQITAVLRFLQRLMPTSILDVGVGNGKMGFLARDFLDVMLGGRYRRCDWRVRIDGIEVFPDYIQDHQRAIYDRLYIGDAYTVIDGLENYDVVIIGDVLEHLERDRAIEFLSKCFRHTQHVILSVPLGEKWSQGAIYGNEFERHLSFWKPEEFEDIAVDKEIVEFPGLGPYGSFLVSKDEYLHGQARKEAMMTLDSEGKPLEAIRVLEERTAGLPMNLSTELLAVEIHVRQMNLRAALERLERVKAEFPAEASIQTFIDQVRNLKAPS